MGSLKGYKILNYLIIAIIPLLLHNCNKKQKKAFSDKAEFIKNISVSRQVITNNALPEQWITEIQQNPKNNYRLENGELLLGNTEYPALSYSGYREHTRGDSLPNKDEYCPTVDQIKEDMRILSAMDVKLIRTYDTQLYKHAFRVLKAINELKQEDPNFVMYVMLGAWIQCKGAYTDQVDHSQEDLVTNKAEMDKAIELAAKYPDIVKIIAVGNEAMVTWQAHYVPAEVILKWVRYAKKAKKDQVNGYQLPDKVLLTSSDNFAPWGGEDNYQDKTLIELIKEVDFISLHTYPFHDTHYNSDFWTKALKGENKTKADKINLAMEAAFERAISQYNLVKNYLKEKNIEKPIHLGETGWATVDDALYHEEGSGATDEIKMKMYYEAIKEWSHNNNVSCFYFEAFNEPWKGGEKGSESHFGLFTVDGKAKYALWHLVDRGKFQGLTRGPNQITKTYGGDYAKLYNDLILPETNE